MITLLYPCKTFWITDTWSDHLRRPGYSRAYAGTDLAGPEQPLYGSQFNGKVLQAHFSSVGYGYTTFVEYYSVEGKPLVRVRNAHQKNVMVSVGDQVTPNTVLGILDSTGKSTGNHTHFETWLYMDGQWQNVDPLDYKNGISLVRDVSELKPFSEKDVGVPQTMEVPNVALPKVRTSSIVTIPLNLRDFPGLSGRVIGKVSIGEEWEYCGCEKDEIGNLWFAVKRGKKIGWAAGLYLGKIYLEVITV
ncbi:MAG: M23 family metallopeptidase [Candidatus Methanomethylicaceae archaeon]